MYHLRQVFVIIGVLTTLYLAGRYSSELIVYLMRPDIGGAMIAFHILEFMLAMIAGALLMKLLTWKFRLPAMLILPAVIPFVFAIATMQKASNYGYDLSFWDALSIVRFLFICVAGILVGALLAHFFVREKTC